MPTGNKLVRAQPLGASEAGDVTLVAGAWNDAFLDEAELFPDGAHDDQIDALSGAMAVVAQRPTHENPYCNLGRRRPRPAESLAYPRK